MDISASWSNVWSEDTYYLIDHEMLETRVRLLYGINRKFQVGGELEYRSYFGGVMDGFIDGFHELFGLTQAEKENYPSNSTHFILRDENLNDIRNTGENGDWDHMSLSVYGTWLLVAGDRQIPAVGLIAQIRQGIDTPFDDSNALDAGIGIGLSKRWADQWYSYHNLSFSWFGETELRELEFKKNTIGFMNALEWRIIPTISLLLQYRLDSAAVEGYTSLNQTTHEFDLGAKWRIGSGGALEFAIVENFINYDRGADVAFHLGYHGTF